jgi:hypothetical protein
MPTIISGDGTISGLTATGISAVQNLPAGSVLQVVSTTYTTAASTTGTTQVDTGLSASITPKFATSKILAIASILGTGKNASNNTASFFLVRGSTTICTVNDCFYTNNSSPNYSPVNLNFLDSPATTSATTYKIQFASSDANSVQFNNASRSSSTITLMEIAG